MVYTIVSVNVYNLGVLRSRNELDSQSIVYIYFWVINMTKDWRNRPETLSRVLLQQPYKHCKGRKNAIICIVRLLQTKFFPFLVFPQSVSQTSLHCNLKGNLKVKSYFSAASNMPSIFCVVMAIMVVICTYIKMCKTPCWFNICSTLY